MLNISCLYMYNIYLSTLYGGTLEIYGFLCRFTQSGLCLNVFHPRLVRNRRINTTLDGTLSGMRFSVFAIPRSVKDIVSLWRVTV